MDPPVFHSHCLHHSLPFGNGQQHFHAFLHTDEHPDAHRDQYTYIHSDGYLDPGDSNPVKWGQQV
jgi:hypothetical protein